MLICSAKMAFWFFWRAAAASCRVGVVRSSSPIAATLWQMNAVRIQVVLLRGRLRR